MKPYFLVFALIACATGLAVMAWPVPSESRVAVAQVDLIALQQQANAALESLRQAQLGRQLAMNGADQRYSLLVLTK